MTAVFPIGSLAAAGGERAREDGAESTLVRRARAGDEAAFQSIVELYQSKVLATIRGIIHQANDADDIAQQVFVKAYFALRRFDGRSSFWSWLYRITVNESYDYLRKRKVRPLVYESDLNSTEDQCLGIVNARAPEDAIDSVLARRQLANWLLQHVSEEERFLLLMKEVEGCSVAELAAMTGVSDNCVKIRLFRARRKMVEAARSRSARRAQPA